MTLAKSILPAVIIAIVGCCAPAFALSISGGIAGTIAPVAATGCGCGCTDGCGSGACGCGDGGVDPDPGGDKNPVDLGPTQTSFTVTNNSSFDYIISGENDPTLTLARGVTYTFNLSAAGHPFYIKTDYINGTGSVFSTGVSGNGVEAGTLIFAVPESAPDTLYYNCEPHFAMGGTINIVDIPEAASMTLLSAGMLMLSLRRRNRRSR